MEFRGKETEGDALISIYTPKKAQKNTTGAAWSAEWRRKRVEVEKRTALRRMLDMEIRAYDLNARAQYEAMTDYALRQISKSCY